MRYLLAAINAKYIHSNLGIYSLKCYAQTRLNEDRDGGRETEILLGEYTINHQMERILQDIYQKNPEVVGFSCYIWNISYVETLVRDLKKIRPDTRICLGGPEVSYDAEAVLKRLPEAELVMMGEGEETFYRLVRAMEGEKLPEAGDFSGIPGIAFRRLSGEVQMNPAAPLLSMDSIPFPYRSLEGMEHRIIYYESSRGCPFSCSYCLSSIDRGVRFRSISLVKKELAFFLERRVPQVKFVDRTFNCRRDHAMAIWSFLKDHDNGITNFHFEISADLLDDEALQLFSGMRPGLIQLEIGVQTVNPQTIREIRRTMDLKKVEDRVQRVRAFGNIHQHLDLIAGLPFEGTESFRISFNTVYGMKPEQLQLGFLKVLKGSFMEKKAEEYGLLYSAVPPYEVLSTRWLPYDDLIRLKGVEEMVEIYYNSGQFRYTMELLVQEWGNAFDLYECLSAYYVNTGLSGISHSRLARYELLYQFIETETELDGEKYRDRLMCDLYLRELLKSRPSFARDLGRIKAEIRAFFRQEAKEHRYLKGYEGYDSRQLSKMAHLEKLGDGSFVLFDYKNRDALLGNAAAFRISEKEMEAVLKKEAESGYKIG